MFFGDDETFFPFFGGQWNVAWNIRIWINNIFFVLIIFRIQ